MQYVQAACAALLLLLLLVLLLLIAVSMSMLLCWSPVDYLFSVSRAAQEHQHGCLDSRQRTMNMAVWTAGKAQESCYTNANADASSA